MNLTDVSDIYSRSDDNCDATNGLYMVFNYNHEAPAHAQQYSSGILIYQAVFSMISKPILEMLS